MTKLISILRYRDPSRAIEGLAGALDFQRHFVSEDEGQILHAQPRLGIRLPPSDFTSDFS